jgi:ribosomal protein L19E
MNHFRLSQRDNKRQREQSKERQEGDKRETKEQRKERQDVYFERSRCFTSNLNSLLSLVYFDNMKT